MTARQLHEQAIDRIQAAEKTVWMAEFDAALGLAEPVKVDGRRRENRKPRKPKTNPDAPPVAPEDREAA